MQHTHSELLRKQRKFRPLRTIAGFVLVPAITIGSLWMYGHPGLRISYTWNGNASHPVYHSCDYLTASGWKSRSYDCTLIKLFPLRKG